MTETQLPAKASLARPDDSALRQLLAGLTAVRGGDFGTRLPQVGDELMDEIALVFNGMIDQLALFTSEVTRVAREVGSEGKLGGQAEVPGVSGSWKDLTDNVNAMAGNLTGQVRDIAQVATAVARGDLSQKITVQARGEILELKSTINTMVDQLSSFADEVTRVAREVGTDGRLGGQADVKGVSGTWRDLTESVNVMASNLTDQVRSIAEVTTAVAKGDLSQKIRVDARGEILELKETINTMVDQLSAFADEVTRVAREVGTDGRLGGQADVKGVSGTWRDLTESVNVMASNLTDQVRSIAEVTTAVAKGDLSQKIRVDARGEILELKETINTMVDQLSAFADEVTRVAREVGTQGNLGGQAIVRGVSGTWKDLTDNVNVMASNLTAQVRSIAQVATGVARGDLSQKITVEAKGEVAALAAAINTMVDTLGAFADEVTRVAREVGTDGRLGGQASVKGVSGTWKDLTDNVNFMANNLTSQVRNIAQVTTAVAQGDLTRKIDVDARGEILELKETINTMVDQLSSFAAEVTRVAREVGTDGILGGQAEVEGLSGTWKRLTENVNELAGNLTRQVRAIAAVTSAVATGDLTRSITVDAQGEVAELKDNINAMVRSLRDTTRMNEEQDWLKTNLARIAGLMQGHRDLATVAQLVIDELAPLVGAQHGTFFLVDTAVEQPAFDLIASYGYRPSSTTPRRFGLGDSLIGQAARTRRTIVVDQTPTDYITIGSSVGRAAPVALVVLPIVFEDQALGVIELASFAPFTEVHHAFLNQLTETIGVNVNTIVANARTDALLVESQRLAGELQARSEELQSRQEDLQRSNDELEEKADLLAQQKHDIEIKNREIEHARQELEERARQLALASKYKSEFLANMSHELRTPLNSLLILAGLLARNPKGNLTAKQVEYAHVIHSAGSDLLQLINDILDLSKVEAGKMDLHVEPVALASLVDDLRATFTPVTTEKGLLLSIDIAPDVPDRLLTDRHRLAQILRNLLSNAVKFTEHGRVELAITRTQAPGTTGGGHVLFAVADTGIGIAEENLDRIFGAFQQGDGTTSRRYGGTGLGLSICREVATLLGGEIRARSVYGTGSTFTLRLPTTPPAEMTSAEPRGATPDDLSHAPSAALNGAVGDGRPASVGAAPGDAAASFATDRSPAAASARAVSEDRPADQPNQAGRIGPASAGDLAPAGDPAPRHDHPVDANDGDEEDILTGRSVLVVDDDVRNVFAITSILEFYGAAVDHAPDGRKGIEKLLVNPSTDLVLMDVMMPEMDGYTTMAAIRAMPRFADIPIIAVTAKAMPDDRQKCLDAGASEYVTKPVDVDELLARVQDVLVPRAPRRRPAAG
ncbi:HAMP domain-containing protein [Frankia sp. CNm7]|uniref:Circadian input-output histidine kinase CikA n=1 Tax=Frankia nepalensis TaxID=1836974 RepID=A0A937RJD8_9ACTN|nr:HAMP domain-containing protein [Frankia nepalensis]MBL7501105.1 HAMP domain-containing protein [Frankia nepalensis]MBL7512727.1 HAMP domain-containing protein [Frankia nepalensis]MBL7524117.1 HAMP domain-containing protein [Frankia nepalensis]MBL7631317.1 HAMP domain-containing protein [Frankia nepalensis]